MTLLKDNNYKDINVALLSLEADIKNKTGFDTSVIDKQLVEINSRIDKINAGSNNTSAQINDIRYEIEDINSKLKGNSAKIENIEQKLADIFSAENKVTDFNTTTNSGIYYWLDGATNKPGTNYGVLLVNKYDSGSNSIWINQIAYGTNNKIYFRQNINSGNWTEWKAVAFDGEITAKKVANALTVNGKTYDGSEAVDAGVQKIENGGTGATTAKDAFMNLANGLSEDNGPLDTEYVAYKNTGGTHWGLYTLSTFWNYIKNKISSVLGLTKDTYGGKSAQSGFLDIYTSSRLTSGNIVPKDSSEYGGMRKDVVTSSMTDSGRPGYDGHLLTMFWDNSGRYDSQFFVSDKNPPIVKVRSKANGTDYGNWVDVITSDNIGSQTVARASTSGTADYANNLTAGAALNNSNTITTTNPTKIGPGQIKVHTVYNANGPATYGNLINIGGNGGFQFFVEWTGSQTEAGQDLIGRIFTRFWRDNQAAWTAWKELAYTTADVTFSTARASSKMVIPIGAPSQLEDGCIWIER